MKNNWRANLFLYVWNGLWIVFVLLLLFFQDKLNWNSLTIPLLMGIFSWMFLSYIDKKFSRLENELKEFVKSEFDGRSEKLEEELKKIIDEPNMVIKDGKIVKVSDEEYKRIAANYEKNGDAMRGDIL